MMLIQIKIIIKEMSWSKLLDDLSHHKLSLKFLKVSKKLFEVHCCDSLHTTLGICFELNRLLFVGSVHICVRRKEGKKACTAEV